VARVIRIGLSHVQLAAGAGVSRRANAEYRSGGGIDIRHSLRLKCRAGRIEDRSHGDLF